MNILIADKLANIAQKSLKQLGCIVYIDASLSEDRLVEALKESNAEILIVRSTKVKKKHKYHNNSRYIYHANFGVF